MLNHSYIQFAFDINKKRISIYDVPFGVNTGCFCRICNEPLGAKNKGKSIDIPLKSNQKVPHFYHINKSDCNGETLIHILAKDIFKSTKKLLFETKIINQRNEWVGNESNLIEFETVDLEEKVTYNSKFIRPDAIATLNGNTLYVEFANSSYVGFEKEELLRTAEQDTLEININVNWIDWNKFQTENELMDRLTTFLHHECGIHQHWISLNKFEHLKTKRIDTSKEELEENLRYRKEEQRDDLKKIEICNALMLNQVKTLENILFFENRWDFMHDINFIEENGILLLKDSVKFELEQFKEEYGHDWG